MKTWSVGTGDERVTIAVSGYLTYEIFVVTYIFTVVLIPFRYGVIS
jgi:hypothetical protein